MTQATKVDVTGDAERLAAGVSLAAGRTHVLRLVPLLIRARWSKHEALLGEEVELVVDLHRRVAGNLELTVFPFPPGPGAEPVARLSAPIEGTTVRLRWSVAAPVPPGNVDIGEPRREPVADLCFVAERGGERVDSGTAAPELLHVFELLELVVRHERDGSLVPGSPYVLSLPDGTVRYGTLDAHSRVHEQDVPRGPVEVLCLYRRDRGLVL